MTIMRKHFRLTEEFTYGTLLIQSAYLPVGQTPADGDWETDHTYDWDSPQETLRTLLSELSEVHQEIARLADSKEGDAKAARHVESTMTRDRDELNALKKQHEVVGKANMHLNDQLNALQAALTEANNQRNELRSQLVTAQKAAEANPTYMSAMDRDTLLRALDERLKGASSNTNNLRTAAVTLIRRNAVPMRLLSIQPTLAECGNLMRAMLYMYYGGHQETAFNEEDKTRARKLHAFILAAKA
jgi:chromosome segregation ATPase